MAEAVGFSIVRLTEAHLAEVLRIEEASNPSPWSEAAFRKELDREEGLFLVALERGRVVGFAGAWLVIDEAHVVNIAVAPDRRRAGIGRRLMETLLSEAASRGMIASTLEVRASNIAGINLYESLGYRACARRKRYYPDNREDAIVMWLYDLPSKFSQ